MQAEPSKLDHVLQAQVSVGIMVIFLVEVLVVVALLEAVVVLAVWAVVA
jgi:hypothetical protein